MACATRRAGTTSVTPRALRCARAAQALWGIDTVAQSFQAIFRVYLEWDEPGAGRMRGQSAAEQLEFFARVRVPVMSITNAVDVAVEDTTRVKFAKSASPTSDTVYMSQLFNARLLAPMDLRSFPFDHQVGISSRTVLYCTHTGCCRPACAALREGLTGNGVAD